MLVPALAVVLSLAASSTPPPVPQDPPAVQAQRPAEKPWPPDGVVRATEKGIVAPRIVKEFKPQYTADARRAKIQGTVVMEAVVRADGTVDEIRVIRSLDSELGLDEQAMSALKKWEFKAGSKDGVPVPVLIEVEMTFVLR